jgi:hypothetical protein
MIPVIKNDKGEIIEIFIDNIGFIPKEQAHKVLYGSVDKVDVEMYLRTIAKPYSVPLSVIDLITDILNEKQSIPAYKAIIMKIDKTK